MAMSAQDKILYVANKLGLATLKDMQGSTGAVYDTLDTPVGTFFSEASKHTQPAQTNLNDNRFEVNEALLVETIGFTAVNIESGMFGPTPLSLPLSQVIGQNGVIVFDLIIGNKQVMKDTPIFAAGSPGTFSSVGIVYNSTDSASGYIPRTQLFLEGAGILIPPQVEWQVNYRIFNLSTGAPITSFLVDTAELQCYLFGTKVNLNFNTSI